MTAPVLLAVNKWTFKPAMLDSESVDSTIIVNIVYNPGDYRLGGVATPVLGKELHVLSTDPMGFLPSKISNCSWAAYPLNSVVQGSVILDARINPTGRVTHISPVWKVEALTRTSLHTAKSWTFEPAMLKGTPIAVDAVIGYVFRPPNIASPVAKP